MGYRKKIKPIFITGTDTDVGKTVATLALGALLQQEGFDVGVMKPVQCAGDDAALLKRELKIEDDLDVINPYFVNEPLSPHLAFRRAKVDVDVDVIKDRADELVNKHDVLLIEGAGGVMVPIKENYLVLDLIDDIDAETVIVTRLGLGTINHTLTTIDVLRSRGIAIKGIIFVDTIGGKKGTAAQTNPDEIAKLTDVPVLGIIPFLKTINRTAILKHVTALDVQPLLKKLSAKRYKLLADADRRHVWHPFTQMKEWENEDPMIIDRGRGSYLIDVDGNEYIDGVSSLWVTVHGHRKKEIDAAIKNQINQISHSTMLGLSNTPAIELAKELVSITPKGLEKVFYSDNGSTSVEIAIKMAYQYWQNIGQTKKTNIVHLEHSYHGDTLGSVSIGGIDLFHQVYRHMIFKTIKLDWPDGYRDQDFGGALKKFEALLKAKSGTIAALVVEPLVQGAAGMMMWPESVLRKLRQLTKKYDVFLVCDEVATGFGRTGKMFACEHENVTPDFLCVSKGLTGGYLPLAATITTPKVYEGFKFPYKEMKTFFHGHTYTGNPLACAAALANIKLFKKDQIFKKVGATIKYLAKKLPMFYTLSSVGDIRQCGMMIGIELVINKEQKTPFDWQQKIGVQVCDKAREYGVILRPLGNVIVLMPPLSINREETDALLEATYCAINDITINIGK